MVSAGCTNCYAMTMAARLEAMGQAKYAGLTRKQGKRALWTGKINLVEDALTIPLERKKPTTWFVNSMSDLFHEDVPFDYVDRVFAVMALCPHHTFQVLTKRPERMVEYAANPGRLSAIAQEVARMGYGEASMGVRLPLPNVHLGTSIENQATADERSVHLRKVPAAVRWYSIEPLLEAVTVPLDGIDWAVVGGESGPGARPCNVEWLRSIVRQFAAAGVPVFVKQLGALRVRQLPQVPHA